MSLNSFGVLCNYLVLKKHASQSEISIWNIIILNFVKNGTKNDVNVKQTNKAENLTIHQSDEKLSTNAQGLPGNLFV